MHTLVNCAVPTCPNVFLTSRVITLVTHLILFLVRQLICTSWVNIITVLIADFCLRPPIWWKCNNVLILVIATSRFAMIFSATLLRQFSNEMTL